MAQVYYCVVFCDKLGIHYLGFFTIENRLLYCHLFILQLNGQLPCLEVSVHASAVQNW